MDRIYMEENDTEKNNGIKQADDSVGSGEKHDDTIASAETTDIVKLETRFPVKNNPVALMVLGGLALLIIMPIIGRYIYTLNNDISNNLTEQDTVDFVDPFKDLALEAKSAYVFDTQKGEVLYSYNENARMPLASLTKIMTALVASEMVPQSTVVSIKSEDIALEGDSGLLTNERWRLSDIIDFTLITSSNDGASAIATVVGSLGQVEYGAPVDVAKKSFVARMNEKAQELELLHTYFLNETGLDKNSSVSGAYGSARDVAYLMWHALASSKSLLEATTFSTTAITSLNEIQHIATNTNSSVDAIPGLIASKTGFTELAGGNLVVAFDAGIGRPIVISVLGSSIDGRFNDVEKLVKASLAAIAQ